MNANNTFPYFFVWPFGTGPAQEKIYSFGYSENLTGPVPWKNVNDLTAEEIGQEMGGN